MLPRQVAREAEKILPAPMHSSLAMRVTVQLMNAPWPYL